MTSVTTKPDSSQPTGETAVYLFDNWFDPIEGGLRDRVREFIHAMIEGELDMALSRPRYARHAKSPSGEAEETVCVTGHRHGHRSRSLMGSFGRVEIEVPRARLNTPDGKTTEWKSKALRAYQRRTLVADALIAGAYLAGTNTRRVRRALASLFGGAVGKDTVSRTADYTDMIYAATRQEIEVRRKAFIRKWRLKHRAVADSLEEAGDRLFTFARLPPSQWRSARTTNAIERLHEEFKRRIKTQTVLPSADTAAMLFWALLASGQINMRKIDGWQTLAIKPIDHPIDLAA